VKPPEQTRLQVISAIFGVTPPTPPRVVDTICSLVESSPEQERSAHQYRPGLATSSWVPSPKFLVEASASLEKDLAEMKAEKQKESKMIKGKESSPELQVFLESRCLCKMSGGKKVFATMEIGPLGYAVGIFPDGTREVSSMPNVYLAVSIKPKAKAKKGIKPKAKKTVKAMKAMKATKAMKPMKKPDRGDEGDEEGNDEGDEGAEEAGDEDDEMVPEAQPAMKAMKKQAMKAMKKPAGHDCVKYTIMLYRNSGAHALRIQGGKQLFQITAASPVQSQLILEEAKNRLQAGAQPEEVKVWARTQAAA
jgi:hypothetical protein